MVWSAIGYNIRSRLLHIQDNLKISSNIREALELEVLPLLQATLLSEFYQDNVRLHVTRFVIYFFQYTLPIDRLWGIFRQLVRYGTQKSFLTFYGFTDKLLAGTFPRVIYTDPL